jgi:hypothetical protein
MACLICISAGHRSMAQRGCGIRPLANACTPSKITDDLFMHSSSVQTVGSSPREVGMVGYISITQGHVFPMSHQHGSSIINVVV